VNPISETVSPAAQSARTTSMARAWDLLLAASRADPMESDLSRIRTLLGQSALDRASDWEAVLRLADQHGTSSLLYQNLLRVGDLVPAAVQASLGRRHERNIHKSLFLARELIRILDCLDGLGVEVVAYKGIVLSEVYYGDMALRQTGDLDLFVHTRHVPLIKNALNDLGYTTRLVIPEEAWEDFLASGYEWTFDGPAGPNLLEVQWALQPRFYAVDFDMDGLFARAVNVTIAGRAVKAPAAEDLLLVLCVHASKHVWGRLIWLCDIAQILQRQKLDWELVQSRARELGIARILGVTLLLAKRLLAAAIPAAIDKAIPEDRAAPALADEIAANMARGVSYDVEQVSYFRLMMRLRERRGDRLRFLGRLTFTPGPGEWEAVRLPKVLFTLYRVVRLGRLAARLARR
jgi:hypothetical protein